MNECMCARRSVLNTAPHTVTAELNNLPLNIDARGPSLQPYIDCCCVGQCSRYVYIYIYIYIYNTYLSLQVPRPDSDQRAFFLRVQG